MAGPFFVDPGAGAGDETGASWTHAKLTLAEGIALVSAAGEIVYCRGTESPSGTITLAQAGSVAAGYIKIIGCAANGDIDGTRYVIDGAAEYGDILLGDNGWHWYENLELKNGDAAGFDGQSDEAHSVFINVYCHHNDADGFDTTGAPNLWFNCEAHDNGDDGFVCSGTNQHVMFSRSYDNTGAGFLSTGTAGIFIGCISHDNGAGDVGFKGIDIASMVFNCVIDSEVTGITIQDNDANVMANRITNCTVGIAAEAAGDNALYGYNVYHTSGANTEVVPSDNIPLLGTTTRDSNDEADADDDGYNGGTAGGVGHDFSLKADRIYNGDGDDVVDMTLNK